jgi:hypothetical protein
MLIKDLEAEAQDDQAEPDGTTYLMDSEPGASAWDQGVENDPDDASTRWDQEHIEESLASEWSNDPEGYRVEQIEDSADHDDLHDDRDVDAEGNFSAEYEPSVSLDDPQPEEEPQSRSSSSESGHEDDDSIEAYMNRLLQRVQGDPNSDVSQPETVTLTTSSASEMNETAVVETEIADESIPDAHDPEAPFVPRSQAPEKSSDLSAMRELANASARSAISRSVRIQTRDTQIKGMVRFAYAIGAVLCGLACLALLPGVMCYLGVAMTIIVAAIYFREGTQLIREASERLKAAEAGEPDDPVADVQPVSEQALEETDETADAAEST